MSTAAVGSDQEAIAEVVRTLFAAFATGPDLEMRIDALRRVFLPGAVIVRACGGEPTAYDVEGFLAPRHVLLSDGTMESFREWEVHGQTHVFGDIAQHLCSYAKCGVQDGAPFQARGVKTLHLVRTGKGWRISAAVWDDERPGLTLAPAWSAPGSQLSTLQG